MKRTPGPWKLIVDDKAYFGDELKIVTDNRHIATVNPATNEGPANAQLIASAPDLLEENARLKELNRELLYILQWLIRLRDGYLKKGSTAPNSAGEYNEAMEQARELLAKAEGEG